MKKIMTTIMCAFASWHIASAEEKTLSTSLTAAYNSKYMLYGYDNGDDLFHGDVYLFYPLSDTWSVWGGSWYGQIEDGTYEEVDVYAGADYAFTEHCSAGIGYSMFNYIETPFATNDIAHEFAVHATYARDTYSLSIRNQYDTEAEGSLTRIIAGNTEPLTDALSLAVSIEAGYAFEYYLDANIWNHALAEISLPFQLSPAINLSPSVGYSIPLAAMDDYTDEETFVTFSASYTF